MDTAPVEPATYEITSDVDLKLATTIIDVPDHMDGDDSALIKVVRYATKEVGYLDSKCFTRKSYTKDDYSDYPANDTFPPTGDQTYQAESDPNFFKKTCCAEVYYAAGRYWFDMRTCKPLALTEV